MTGDQVQKAHEFIKKIDREVVREEHHHGYNLKWPDGTRFRFGFVRYNIKGHNALKYNVQAKGAYRDDPLGKFEGNAKQYFVSPCDDEGIRYAVRVLESCYDYGR